MNLNTPATTMGVDFALGMNSQAGRAVSKLLAAAVILGALGYAGCGGKGIDPSTAGATGIAGSGAGAGGAAGGSDGLGGQGNAAGAGVGENAAGAAGAAGIVACDPTPVGDWKPIWTPPVAPIPGACSSQQISSDFALCTAGPSYDPAACSAFEIDPGNLACRSCLFTTTNQSEYGAVIIDPSDFWQVNIAGCIAELDGDASANGCAAKQQAYSDCSRKACEAGCWVGKPAAAYVACNAKAAAGDCQSYQAAAVCAKSPRYAVCYDYTSFGDFFRGVGGVFCSTGFGSTGEGGAAGASP